MDREAEDDFITSVSIVVMGMLVPPVMVSLASDPAALPVSGWGIIISVSVGFGFVSWTIIDWVSLDRVNFLTASIVVPWVFLIAIIYLVLFLNRDEQIPRGPLADIFRFLIGPDAGFFVYGAAFMLAGVMAVGLSELFRSRSGGTPISND